MLTLVNKSRVISRRNLWIARITATILILPALPRALIAGSLASFMGQLFGFALGASLFYAGAYRLASIEESNASEDSLPAESDDSGPEACPECDLALAMGVEECQRCGWNMNE